ETIHSRKDSRKIINYDLGDSDGHEILLRGIAVGDKGGSGKVRVVNGEVGRIGRGQCNKGDGLVTEMTDPDWELIMQLASAMVTERGGRTCHAAIVARELGIPAVVGAQNARQLLEEGCEVTVSCAQGDVGFVYNGLLNIIRTEIDVHTFPESTVPIMLNVASPDIAFQY